MPRPLTGTVRYDVKKGAYQYKLTLPDGSRTPWIAVTPTARSAIAEARVREVALEASQLAHQTCACRAEFLVEKSVAPDDLIDVGPPIQNFRCPFIRDPAVQKKERIKQLKEKFAVRVWAKEAIRSARRRAVKRGLDFDLDECWLIGKLAMISTRCPALGTLLKFSAKGYDPSSASLDRILPNLGYVKGNVEIISRRANTIKNDATPEELVRIARWVSRARGNGSP
jgi:hypothetical protein